MARIMKIIMMIPLLYLAVIPFLLEGFHNSTLCSRVVINIVDSSHYNFVTKSQILNLVYNDNIRILGGTIEDIPVSAIENRINELRELKTAEVYIDFDGTLYVYADQRNPLFRIIPDEGGDFFMDEEGYIFRKRNLYTPRLHIAVGNIDITPAMLENVSVLDTCIKKTILKDLFHFVKYIRNDGFWSAQIDQIYIDSREEIDLFPRVGNHLIHLGPVDNFDGKLRNLQALYEEVMPVAGWNRYSMINLEYKDQIVCRRRQ